MVTGPNTVADIYNMLFLWWNSVQYLAEHVKNRNKLDRQITSRWLATMQMATPHKFDLPNDLPPPLYTHAYPLTNVDPIGTSPLSRVQIRNRRLTFLNNSLLHTDYFSLDAMKARVDIDSLFLVDTEDPDSLKMSRPRYNVDENDERFEEIESDDDRSDADDKNNLVDANDCDVDESSGVSQITEDCGIVSSSSRNPAPSSKNYNIRIPLSSQPPISTTLPSSSWGEFQHRPDKDIVVHLDEIVRVMKERWLDGLELEFDYGPVDADDHHDDHLQMNRESQEKYFDADWRVRASF